jgi:hypothetical protein
MNRYVKVDGAPKDITYRGLIKGHLYALWEILLLTVPISEACQTDTEK